MAVNINAEKIRRDADLEAGYKKLVEEDKFVIQGVIVFSSASSQYEYVPMEGFPGFPTMPAMVPKIDLLKADLELSERKTDFDLKTPRDEFGLPAKIFLRVESGNYDVKMS